MTAGKRFHVEKFAPIALRQSWVRYAKIVRQFLPAKFFRIALGKIPEVPARCSPVSVLRRGISV